MILHLLAWKLSELVAHPPVGKPALLPTSRESTPALPQPKEPRVRFIATERSRQHQPLMTDTSFKAAFAA
jgi:hypothetical protein